MLYMFLECFSLYTRTHTYLGKVSDIEHFTGLCVPRYSVCVSHYQERSPTTRYAFTADTPSG